MVFVMTPALNSDVPLSSPDSGLVISVAVEFYTAGVVGIRSHLAKRAGWWEGLPDARFAPPAGDGPIRMPNRAVERAIGAQLTEIAT